MDGGAGIDSSLLLFVAVASPSSSAAAAANDVAVREESDRVKPSAPRSPSLLLLLVLLPAGECLGETCTVYLGDRPAAVGGGGIAVVVDGPCLGGEGDAVVARRL